MAGPPGGSVPGAADGPVQNDPVTDPLSVCFVCTGNICRSPMAAVVLAELAAVTSLADGSLLGGRLVVTSAGTSGWHSGEPMDPRARSALERRGYPDCGHRAQAFASARFATTDLVVCLDRGHQQTLLGLARSRPGTTGSRSAWSCCAGSMPAPAELSMSPIPTTATTPTSRPAWTWWSRAAGGWWTNWSEDEW